MRLKSVLLLVAAVGLVVGALGLPHRWPFLHTSVESIPASKNGRYYRVAASYLYKGQPVDFDIVVGCNARITNWIDRDRSVEVGLVPFVYGLKMADGQGVVLRVPELCDRSPSKGYDDMTNEIPLTGVFETAEQPRFGWLYATHDAYQSPLAELKYITSQVRPATFEEFRAWRKTEAPKNIIKPDMFDDTGGSLNPNQRKWKPGEWRFGMNCEAVTIKPIPEPARPVVRALWQRPDPIPEYWTPDMTSPGGLCIADKECSNREGAVRLAVQAPEPGKLLWHQVGLSYRLTGRRDRPIPNLRRDQPIIASEVYPVQHDFTQNRIGLEPMPQRRLFAPNFVIINDRLGFAYCDGRPYSPKTAQTFMPAFRLVEPTAFAVNGVPLPAPDPERRHADFLLWRDEKIIEYSGVTLSDIFGGL